MKRKVYITLIFAFFISILAGCGAIEESQPNEGQENGNATPSYSERVSLDDFNIITDAGTKVILDCDMSYANDDAFAMMFLARADELGYIDLLGVAVSGGNKTGAVAVNMTLLQLEAVGRTDIPVYIGRDEPLLGFQPKRASKLSYAGGVYDNLDKYVSPENYHNLGELYSSGWGYSVTEAQNISSAEFMVEQVKQYPGEVVILCVGPATNVALACQADENFASNTAGIIYMGGNIGDDSSFNWSYDADAVKICLESDFTKQIICTSEIVETMKIPSQFFDELAAYENSAVAQFLVSKKSIAVSNRKLWDVVIPAILLCPELIETTVEDSVAVSTDEDNYGAMYFTEDGAKAVVVSGVNGPDIYALMRELFKGEN